MKKALYNWFKNTIVVNKGKNCNTFNEAIISSSMIVLYADLFQFPSIGMHCNVHPTSLSIAFVCIEGNCISSSFLKVAIYWCLSV